MKMPSETDNGVGQENLWIFDIDMQVPVSFALGGATMLLLFLPSSLQMPAASSGVALAASGARVMDTIARAAGTMLPFRDNGGFQRR